MIPHQYISISASDPSPKAHGYTPHPRTAGRQKINFYEARKILNVRMHGGRRQFYADWKPGKDGNKVIIVTPSWEPQSCATPALIQTVAPSWLAGGQGWEAN